METLFLNIVNISITASWVILAVIFIRFIFKSAPKSYRILLWSLVGIRLITPITIESKSSLIPSASTIPTNITSSIMPSINSGISGVDNRVNYIISESIAQSTVDTLVLDISKLCAWIWIGGIVVLCGYCIFSYVKLYCQTKASIRLKENVYACDFIASPFILGFFQPKIYVPSNLAETQLNNILMHEYAHIKRKDYIWKPIGYILLTLHWFNPLVWLSYSMVCKDIELACDEKAIKDMSSEEKKAYSQTLLDFSIQKYSVLMCPVAFGEVGVKERIKAVLQHKKPGTIVLLVCILVGLTTTATLMVNPISKRTFIAQVSSIRDHGVIIADMDSETYTHYYIPFDDFEDDLLSTINLNQFYKISASKKTTSNYPSSFDKIYDIELYEEDPNNRLPIVLYSESNYADIRNATKVTLTKDNFDTYFDIEELAVWSNDAYPHLIYSLKLKDEYQLAYAENQISYTYHCDIVKRFLNVDDTTKQITWTHSAFVETKKEQHSYTQLGGSMSFGNALEDAYYHENNEVYILAKENIQMTRVEGTIYVAPKHIGDSTITDVVHDLNEYQNAITINSYIGKEEELCTHPRGTYEKENIKIQIVSEPHIFHTYYLDITNTTIQYVQRMYFNETYYQTICEYLLHHNFVKTGD